MEYPTSRQNHASLARFGKYRSKDRRRSRKWGDIRSRHGSSTSEDRNSRGFFPVGRRWCWCKQRSAHRLIVFVRRAGWRYSTSPIGRAALRFVFAAIKLPLALPIPTTGRTRSPRGARLAHGLRVSKATTAAALGWQAGSTDGEL